MNRWSLQRIRVRSSSGTASSSTAPARRAARPTCRSATGDRAGGRAGSTWRAAKVLDADGLIVTPGFVDIHTHFDGQATWDPLLAPSSLHGVTSVAMGNCGVGFARPAHATAARLAHQHAGGRGGHPRHRVERGHALGLGDVPRVPRRARPEAASPWTWAPRSHTQRCAPTCWASVAPTRTRSPPPTSWPPWRGPCAKACRPERSASPPAAPWRTARRTACRWAPATPAPTNCSRSSAPWPRPVAVWCR
jgi:hypothetical protein